MKRKIKTPKTDIKEIKARKYVPKGTPYCYTWSKGKFYFCPYYKSSHYSNLIASCRLMKNVEIWDMVKSCGVNWN